MLHKRKDSPYWWVSFTDASGKRARRSTGTANRKEAEAIAAKWTLETFHANQWGKQPSRTFDELMLAYLKATVGEKRSAERDKYSAKPLYQFFTGRQLETLKAFDIRGYIDRRKSDGLKPASIRRELELLSSAINYARREWEWDIPNPVTGRKPKKPEGRVRYISRLEADALIEAAKASRTQQLADLIRLGLNTGMRRNEMLNLEWKRVDLRAGLLHLEGHHTKSGKRRSIPINAESRVALLSLARFRAEHCPSSPWVFSHKNGEHMQRIQRSFTEACKRAGITDFRIHDLRHTCASWLVSAGVSLVVVRDLLGHSTIEMTERYAHLAPENLREAVQVVGERLIWH